MYLAVRDIIIVIIITTIVVIAIIIIISITMQKKTYFSNINICEKVMNRCKQLLLSPICFQSDLMKNSKARLQNIIIQNNALKGGPSNVGKKSLQKH